MLRRKQKMTKLCMYVGADTERFEKVLVCDFMGEKVFFGLSQNMFYQLTLDSMGGMLTFHNQKLPSDFELMYRFLHSEDVSCMLSKKGSVWYPD